MSEDAVRRALQRRIIDNVRLIRTIPSRMHAGLMRRIAQLAGGRYRFDPQMLERVLQAEYRVTGYNLRRLTRDQTTKQIGELTQIRHQQSGFTEYEWVSAGDNRVRPQHAANDGEVFRWDNPPGTGHPGAAIQCRCQASARLSAVDLERLGGVLG